MTEKDNLENSTAPASPVGRLVIRKGYPTKKSIMALADKHDLVIHSLDLYNSHHKIVWSGRNDHTDKKAIAFNKELNAFGFNTVFVLPDGFKTGMIRITNNV